MITTIRKEWQVVIPESMIREIGVCAGSALECRIEEGEIRLRPAPVTGEKEFTQGDMDIREAAAGQAADARLTVCCFGKLTLFCGNRYINLKNRKARELIAFLICTNGKPARKTRAAEILWPDAAPENAMSSLYKVCRHIREFSCNGFNIPVAESRGEIWLDMTGVICDLRKFEKLYADRSNVESCTSAIELYEAQLFFDESYDWVLPFEAYYDIRYVEMLEILTSHYSSLGNTAMAAYYKSKME